MLPMLPSSLTIYNHPPPLAYGTPSSEHSLPPQSLTGPLFRTQQCAETVSFRTNTPSHCYLALPKLKNKDPFQFYAHTVKFGLNLDRFVANSFISVLSGCGYLRDAHQVFVESTEKDVIAWTALVDGFVKNGCGLEAMKCFVEMRLEGVRVDEVSVVSALCAAGVAGDVWFGRCVHGFYVEGGRVRWDVFVGSALVDMYMKCGCHDDARKVFDAMPSKNVVSWSVLIAGYVRCEVYKDALLVLKCMVLEVLSLTSLHCRVYLTRVRT